VNEGNSNVPGFVREKHTYIVITTLVIVVVVGLLPAAWGYLFASPILTYRSLDSCQELHYHFTKPGERGQGLERHFLWTDAGVPFCSVSLLGSRPIVPIS
jgi:hypothetical protein